MENTIENKQKFFSLYFGQRVYKASRKDGTHEMTETLLSWTSEQSFLELKPLSEITDDEAISIAQLYPGNIRGGLGRSSNEEKIRSAKELIKCLPNGERWPTGPIMTDILKVIDYLRSRGYLLPFMGLSCDELIQRGWAMYAE